MAARRDTKAKILESGLREFSRHGYQGGRVEEIARLAGVNKAMIFYYYGSKRELFRQVLRSSLEGVFSEVTRQLHLQSTVENLVEKLPEIQVQFLSKNPDFLKMVGLTLLQDPELIKDIVKRELAEKMPLSPQSILQKIRQGHKEGKITESDPLQFLINLISLNVFIFMGKPIIEAILDVRIDRIPRFDHKRVESIRHIIKRGMMK